MPSDDNIVLEHLRRIRQSLDQIQDDVNILKVRSTATESGMGSVVTHLAAMNHRMDRFDERLGRIERRLELVEA